MFDICLLGTGGMMPLPYRWLTSLMTRYNGSQILIDCGEGTQIAVKEKGWSFKPIDLICFTHYHADHISGLPGLLLTMGNSERTEPLLLAGPRGLERVVNALRTIAPELPFPLEFHEFSEKDDYFQLKGQEIHAFRVNHNVTCYGYSISIPRAGRFQADKAQALGIPVRSWNLLQKGQSVDFEGRTFTPDMVMGPPRQGLKVTYCTDTRPTESLTEAARGSNLLICEGMYGETDKDSKALEHKHMTFREAARIAAAAQPGEMWLTHYSPSLSHPEEYLDEVRKIFPAAVAARDGRSVELGFTEE